MNVNKKLNAKQENALLFLEETVEGINPWEEPTPELRPRMASEPELRAHTKAFFMQPTPYGLTAEEADEVINFFVREPNTQAES